MLVTQQLLNLGCGRHYHRAWTNVDLTRHDPQVVCHDIRRGIPFAANQFDAVYHSHLLEHLTPPQGEQLIAECWRVLRPGGILRIVVPDLECIARLYLETQGRAWQGDTDAQADYRWMTLEMLDQLVRRIPGGLMREYMTNPNIVNAEFVRSRVGCEYALCRVEGNGVDSNRLEPSGSLRSRWSALRRRMGFWLVRRLLGREQWEAVEEGLFRQSGEIHRWMYDRYSLRLLCEKSGFINFQVCAAEQSAIENFPRFFLDTVNGEIRKPDSLYVECRKAQGARRAAA